MEKKERAEAVLDSLLESGRGVLSVQVLGEFFRVSTQRIVPPLPPPLAQRVLLRLVETLHVLETKPSTILEAARGAPLHSLSFWDAVIWAAAKQNGVRYLLTEDMQPGRSIEGVQIVNPLEPSFELASLA